MSENTQEHSSPRQHRFITEQNYTSLEKSVLETGYDPKLWDQVVNFAEPHFDGRPKFEHHTWAVVSWAAELVKNAKSEGVEVNPNVVITASFLHDIGYELKQSTGPDDLLKSKAKDIHQEVGRKKAEPFLNELKEKNMLNEDEVTEILHIIEIHDKLDFLLKSERSNNLNLMVAADTLGAIDLNFGKPSFDRDQLLRWLRKGNSSRQDMLPAYAMGYYYQLMGRLLNFYPRDKKS